MYKIFKYILLLCLLFSVQIQAQTENVEISDSVHYVEDENISKSDNNLLRLNQIPIDETNREVTFFNENFREKYKSDPDMQYSKGKGGKTFFQKLNELIEQFFRMIFGWDKDRKMEKSTIIALKVLSVLVILTLLFFAVKYAMRYKGRWFFQKKNQEITIDVNDVEQLIERSDFEKLIAESEKSGDVRQSIRLYYLWLLKMLKEKGKIVWNAEKTNSDYAAEIKDEDLKKQFEYLSYLYDYIWYGEFEINDTEYVNAKNAFLKFLKK